MRRTGIALAALLVACDPPVPVCDDVACAAACREHEASMEALVEPGGTLLSAYETALLYDHVIDLRQGLTVTRIRLCAGRDACEVEVQGADPLPQGPYVVVAEARAPSLGTWKLSTAVNCKRGIKPVREEIRTALVRPGTEATVVVDRFEAGPHTRPENNIYCSWTVQPEGDDGSQLRTVSALRY